MVGAAVGAFEIVIENRDDPSGVGGGDGAEVRDEGEVAVVGFGYFGEFLDDSGGFVGFAGGVEGDGEAAFEFAVVQATRS